jgi:hypothetical protein
MTRFKDWPFELGEEVSLCWLRSPWKDPVTRDWLATAVFRRQSGEFRDVTFYWSAFPRLRFGLSFQDARQIGPVLKKEQIYRLNLGSTVLYEITRAYDIPEIQQYGIQGQENLEEYCLNIMSTKLKQRVILPALVYIQSRLATFEKLALGILEPNYFERYILNHHVAEDTLFLDLSADAPKKLLHPKCQETIAGLLYEPTFRAIWDMVRRERLLTSKQQVPLSTVPLVTHLPQRITSSVLVSGINIGSSLLIQRILELGIDLPLPFNRVIVTHPAYDGLKEVPLYTNTNQKHRNGTTIVMCLNK